MMIYSTIFLLFVACTTLLYLVFLKMFKHFYMLERLQSNNKNLTMEKTIEAKLLLKKRLTKKKGFFVKVENLLQDAALEVEAKRFLSFVSGILFGTAFLVFITFGSFIFSLIVVFVLLFTILAILNGLKKKRINKFSSQLSDIVDFLSGSLKSGYSLMQALSMVVEDSKPPASLEFGRVLEDINLGKSYEEAFEQLVERNPNEDVEILVTAILISKETGGNLSFILDTVANTIRERERLKGQLGSLTAQGRLSGIVLMLLPIGIFIFMSVINPQYIKTLITHPLGKRMIMGAVAGQIAGGLLIKKIIKIER